MSVRIDDILGRFKKVRPTGPQQWQALCPAHDDKVPSFHIATGDNGNILVHCKAGCSFDKICMAMNVSPKDLFAGDNSKPIKSNGKNKLLSDSDIRTLTPEELNVFAEQREVAADALMLFEPKRHVSKPWIVLPGYNPSGTKPCGYIWLDPNGGLVTLADGRKEKSSAIGKHGFLGVPWIKKENPEEIILAEGWRDALAAIGQCFCATAPSGGASTFKKEWVGLFQNRIVYICFDCDKPGVKAARKVAKMITPVAKEVRIIKLPYEIAKDHGDDLHDYLVRDKHTQADLQQLINETKLFTPKPEKDTDFVIFGMDRTDAANAERFVHQHKSRLRYCRQWKTWLYNDGRRWDREIGLEQAYRFALETAKSIVDEAQKLPASSNE